MKRTEEFMLDSELECDLALYATVMDRRTYLEWKTGITLVQLK